MALRHAEIAHHVVRHPRRIVPLWPVYPGCGAENTPAVDVRGDRPRIYRVDPADDGVTALPVEKDLFLRIPRSALAEKSMSPRPGPAAPRERHDTDEPSSFYWRRAAPHAAHSGREVVSSWWRWSGPCRALFTLLWAAKNAARATEQQSARSICSGMDRSS